MESTPIVAERLHVRQVSRPTGRARDSVHRERIRIDENELNLRVGQSRGGSDQLGAFIPSTIALHNVPEGSAVSLVLVPRGTPVRKTTLWSVFTSLPLPVMAAPAFLFVSTFEPLLPVGLGLAAGAMIWVVFAELVLDAIRESSGAAAGLAATLALAAMLAFQHHVLWCRLTAFNTE